MPLNVGTAQAAGSVSISGSVAVTLADLITRLLGVIRTEDASESRASRAFMGYVNQGAVAAENSHVQIHNPAASGKTVIVRSVRVSATVATYVRLAIYNTALTTSVATKANKDSGGAAPVANIRSATNAGELGTAIGSHRIAAVTPTEMIAAGPILLGAGEGLVVLDVNVNDTLTGTFEWTEE